MSNQYPTSPPPGPVNRPPASSMIERLPRGLSTRANLLAFVVAAVFSIIAYVFASIGRYVHFGYWRLVWVAAYCVIGLIAALACALLVTYLRRRGRRAQAKGNASSGKLYAIVSLAVGVVSIVIAAMSGVYGIAVARDFVEGPRAIKVTSCQLTQKAHYKPAEDHRTLIDYYDNHITMTLEEGTTHTVTLETSDSDDLTKNGGVSAFIYETCKARSGATSLTVDVYRHSWIVVDARVE